MIIKECQALKDARELVILYMVGNVTLSNIAEGDKNGIYILAGLRQSNIHGEISDL